METLNKIYNDNTLTFRDFMVKTFTTMGVGLGITTVVSVLLSYVLGDSWYAIISGNPLLVFVPLVFEIAIAIFFGVRLRKMSSSTAWICFILYSVVTGISLSIIFLYYTAASVAEAFGVCTVMFVCMAIVGKNTKADLTKIGTYLVIGLIAIVVASIVNFFIRSSMLNLILCYVGIVLFLGLIVYDTKKLRVYYEETIEDADANKKAMIFGAFQLYLDFINLFLRILEILGKKRD